jgi:hypothetical protein
MKIKYNEQTILQIQYLFSLYKKTNQKLETIPLPPNCQYLSFQMLFIFSPINYPKVREKLLIFVYRILGTGVPTKLYNS